MTPELSTGPTMADRWHAEVRVQSAGTEHGIGRAVVDRDGVLDLVAGAVAALTELLLMLDEDHPEVPPVEPAPGTVATVRELWFWRVSWSSDDDVQHVAQAWELTAEDLWRSVDDSLESLIDIREFYRQRRLRHRLDGAADQEWLDQLAAYDDREADSAQRLIDLQETIRRLTDRP